MLRRIVLVLVGLVAATVLGAGPALALDTHVFSASFGEAGSGAGQVSLAGDSGVAVNTSTHDVYVADTGNARVDEFSSTGAFVRAWGWGVADGLPGFETCALACQAGTQGSGAGQFTTPAFVAVDNSASASAGDVYVGDKGTNTVLKFTAEGLYISTNDGSGATAPVAGPFGALAGVTVDGSGNLWVYDESANMFEFAQDGSFTTDWNSGRGVTANGIDADSAGNLYVVTGSGSVEQFTASGTDVGPVNGDAENPTGFALDRSSDELYMGSGGVLIRHYASPCDAGGSCAALDTFGSEHLNGAAGLAVDSSDRTVYAADTGDGRVDVFAPATLPDVSTGAASAGTQGTATLEGTVNANGTTVTDCHFSYVEEAGYAPGEADPYAAGQTAPCASTPSGSNPEPVTASLTGLTPGAVYHYRLSAANSNGTVTGSDETVSTGPSIDSTYASEVTSTSATLHAQINPRGLATTYHFEYGTSASYGQSTLESASIGADNEDHTVSAHIQGLQPGTAYHYRVVASNALTPEGLDGPDHALATQSAATGAFTPPDSRGYELVTPTDKGDGSLPPKAANGLQASANGDGLAYVVSTPFPGAAAGAFNNYLAARSAGGWSSQDLTPPQATANVTTLLTPAVEAFSSDLSKAAFEDGGSEPRGQDFPPLVPGEPQNNKNVFVRDNTTSTYQLVDVTPPGVTPASASFEGASADLGHILFGSTAQLVPGAAAGQANLYEWSGGSVSLAGLVPVAPATRCGAGGPACVASPQGAVLGQGSGANYPTSLLNAVSLDGSKVFFTNSSNPDAVQGQLYVRENGAATVEISASQKANGSGPGGTDPAGPRFPRYWPPTTDGAKAFFTSCEQLTGDSTANSSQSSVRCTGAGSKQNALVGNDLYEYDTASGALSDLTVDHSGDSLGADVQGVFGVSADGSYVYFVANGVLAAGASPGDCHNEPVNNEKGQCNLYLAHGGTTTFIARIDDEVTDIGGWSAHSTTARVTPDGTHLAFETRSSVTGYDNLVSDGSSSCDSPLAGLPSGDPHCSEVYLYDAASHGLRCASCNPTGARPRGAARLEGIETSGVLAGNGGGAPMFEYLPRSLSGDGARLFFESEDALVPGDVNAKTDVYEYEDGRASLISNGTSSDDSVFLDASASGDDVFFLTRSQLVGQDSDQQRDIYDARVGGGFPFTAPSAPCSGEACKPPPAGGPVGPSLASGAAGGAGNLVVPVAVGQAKPKARPKTKPKAKPGKCNRGHARKRGKCVKKPRKKAKRATQTARGGK